MGVCNIRNMDLFGVLGKASWAWRTLIIRTFRVDGQVERHRIGEDEGWL